LLQERRKEKVRKISIIVLVAGSLFLMSGIAMAGNSATQTVTYAVSAINEISVSGNPAALTVSIAPAGSAPNSVSDATTTYAITTNEAGQKITGAIDTDMPAGVTLTVNLTAPSGGTSAGATSLSSSAADLVTGITKFNESGKAITYSLSATSAAGVVGSDTKTVTLTVVDGS
jgi:hypothetical protein